MGYGIRILFFFILFPYSSLLFGIEQAMTASKVINAATSLAKLYKGMPQVPSLQDLTCVSPETRWAKLGIDLRLSKEPRIQASIEEYKAFREKITTMNAADTLLSTAAPTFSNEFSKLSNRHKHMLEGYYEAALAYNAFLASANPKTAEDAALFLRASFLLEQDNQEIVPDYLKKWLKQGRDKVRKELAVHLVQLKKAPLESLTYRGYDLGVLYSQDEQAEALKARQLQEETKIALEQSLKMELDDDDDFKSLVEKKNQPDAKAGVQ